MKNSSLKELIKTIISEVLKENPNWGSQGLDPDVNTGGFDAGNGFQTNMEEVMSEEAQYSFKNKLKMTLNVGTPSDTRIRNFYLQNLKKSDPKRFNEKIENDIKPRIIDNIMQIYMGGATSVNKEKLTHQLKHQNFPENQIEFIISLLNDEKLIGSGEQVLDMTPKAFISVRQGQEVDKSGKQFKDGVTKISDIEIDGRKIKYTDSSNAGWGSSTWKIQSNGSIKMVSEDWDTSG